MSAVLIGIGAGIFIGVCVVAGAIFGLRAAIRDSIGRGLNL